MKTIGFFPHNIEKIKAGLKTQTRRTRPYDIVKGDLVQVEEDTGLTIQITEVRGERLRAISDEDAVKEGYANSAEFLKGDWAAEELRKGGNPWVWVISFKLFYLKLGDWSSK